MATFDPRSMHDVLLKLAETAYLQNVNPALDLPVGYVVVGQITADPATTANLMAMAPPQHQQMMMKLALAGPVFGWVVQNTADATAVVTFRGTQSAEDWLANLDFSPAAYQPVPGMGTVHAGFQICYMAIRNSILASLGRVAPPMSSLDSDRA